jgi:5-(carboxyamino)imidazole ribonucleotide mutase
VSKVRVYELAKESGLPNKEVLRRLTELGVAWEADVVSAHRMPTEMVEWGQQAHTRGLKAVIAGAGGAAHLPGMLASVTPLPVIGVPVPLKNLDGMESFFSRHQNCA